MKCKLMDVCRYRKDRISVDQLNLNNYISTENMLTNKNGITQATGLPTITTTQAFRAGDILVSNIRPYFRKIYFSKFSGGCSNDVLVFEPYSNVNSKFLYYVLSDDRFFDHCTATAKGTKMPRGDKGAIMQYQINLPDLPTQRKIAKILSALDDKIELNNRINQNLEAQAQAIYKHMFVNNNGYKFKKGVLGEIAEIIMGQSPSGSTYNERGIGSVFFQGRAEFGERFPSIRLYTTEPNRMACANDVLMSVRAPVGDLNIAHDNCCIGRGLAAIRSKTNHQSFVLYTLLSLKKELEVFNGEGTVFGSINRDSLKNIPVIIPKIQKIDEFEKLVSPIDTIIRNNYDEICTLKQTRDTLLPKLMSGELDVENLNV